MDSLKMTIQNSNQIEENEAPVRKKYDVQFKFFSFNPLLKTTKRQTNETPEIIEKKPIVAVEKRKSKRKPKSPIPTPKTSTLVEPLLPEPLEPCREPVEDKTEVVNEQNEDEDDPPLPKIIMKKNFSGRQKKEKSLTDADKSEEPKPKRPRVYKYSPCEICGKMIKEMKTHMMVHTGEKRFKCEFCEKEFAHRSDLKHHTYTHTGERPYKCTYCPKAFAHYKSLKTHTVTHTKTRNYKCELCGKTYGHSVVLRTHMRAHLNDRRHECEICFKAFLSKQVLKNHMLTHTGEKPHQCEICSKCFRRPDNLKAHQRTHTKEKPYKCALCEMAFGYKKALADHSKSHEYIPQDYSIPSTSAYSVMGHPPQLPPIQSMPPMPPIHGHHQWHTGL